MSAHEPRFLALLPAVGLCSCVASSEAPATAAPDDRISPAPGLIEIEPRREPLTIAEAMIRSGRESLAAGDFEAAHATLFAAMQEHPEHAAELTLDLLDAALGAYYLQSAHAIIDGLPEDPQRQRRLLTLRELENGLGVAPCDATIDPQARTLRRAESAFAAWNELRVGLPADHAIPIPTTEEQAHAALCGSGCAIGEPSFARLDGDNEATIGLVLAHEDGSFSVMPDLLHTVNTGCGDRTTLGFEQHGTLLRVRAFGDRLYQVDPDDWKLVELPQYGTPTVSAASSPSYAYASPSYAYASSGYHGYAYYGCGGYGGGYDYRGYDSCVIEAHVERDVVLDLARGEVVLDIVRTGDRGSALGRVTMASAPAGPIVDVDACGVSNSLQLRYSAGASEWRARAS